MYISFDHQIINNIEKMNTLHCKIILNKWRLCIAKKRIYEDIALQKKDEYIAIWLSKSFELTYAVSTD